MSQAKNMTSAISSGKCSASVTAVKSALVSALVSALALSSCGPFKVSSDSDHPSKLLDFKFSGEGFAPHNEQVLTVALINKTDQSRVELKSVVVSQGSFQFTMPGILTSEQDYFLDYFADYNGNGSCDAPPKDHVWRLDFSAKDSPVDLTDEHTMNFSDSCKSFSPDYAPAPSQVTNTVVGSLKLGAEVTAQGFSQGQALTEGVIFLEGFPDQATRSNQTGQFVLKISTDSATTKAALPARHGAMLSANQARLVMWYTQKPSAAANKNWSLSELKFGSTKEVDLNAPQLDVGDQGLTYTKGIKLKTIDSQTKKFIANCWIHSKSFGSRLVVATDPQDFYRIDYLPAGTYLFQIDCDGYQSTSLSVNVSQATSAQDPWEFPPPVELVALKK